MINMEDSCVQPARGPLLSAQKPGSPEIRETSNEEAKKMVARVGKEAPDFEANAFISGKGFKPVKLSDYKGKWIVVCFYPGDFTFV